MKLDLDELLHGLSGYTPRITDRPDGSVLLVVTHGAKRFKRVVDNSYSTEELIRQIKFDLLCDAEDVPVAEAAKFSITHDLPTYTNVPICRTRSASLWESRKLKNL